MAGSKAARKLGYDRRDEAIGCRYCESFRTMHVGGDTTDLFDDIAGIAGIVFFLEFGRALLLKVLFWWDESGEVREVGLGRHHSPKLQKLFIGQQ